MSDSTIFSGCIDGMVFASNINKGMFLWLYEYVYRAYTMWKWQDVSHN